MPDTGVGPKLGIVAAAAVGIFVLLSFFYKGPTSTPPTVLPAAPASAPVNAQPGASAAAPNVNLQCLVEHVQKAPAPFHLSYKKSTQVVNSDWETDISANSISGMVVTDTGTQAIHGTRGNKTAWGAAVATVTAPISGSARTFGLVRNSSATTPAGHEIVNGENTLKYTIDSAHDTAADAAEVNGLLGAGGYIRGTAWVTKDGCPVKLVLDSEMHMPDGNVEKEHYEEQVTQKQ
jgi:hypothetical protein